MTTIVVRDAPVWRVVIDHAGDRTVLVAAPPAPRLVLAATGLQGPPGPPGPVGPPGPSGAVQEQTFAFAAPAPVWVAEHTLPLANPGVYTLDSSGAPIAGDLSFPTPATVRVEWAWPMAGTLVLTT